MEAELWSKARQFLEEETEDRIVEDGAGDDEVMEL